MTVESIAEFYRDTEFGRKLRREGRAEGREELLAELLRDRFGDHPGVLEVADRLSSWPNSGAIRAVMAATTLDDLPATPPT
jgi:hypothetical protein